MNKKLVSKILLVIMMVGIVTFFTGCSVTSGNMNVGVSMLGDAVRMIFNGLVNGVVTLVVGVFEGIWQIIVGLFNIIIGAVAWVVELIVGLF